MDDPVQAEAYAKSDFTEPHEAFVALFRRTFPVFTGGLIADLGCGNADPTIRFARAYPQVKLVGFDGSDPMIAFGNAAIEEAGLSGRIVLEKRILPGHGYPSRSFDGVISNSFLHQLHDPRGLWQTVKELAKQGAPVFIMDLTRPPTEEDAHKLVALHTQEGDPEPMKKDYFNSLCAAFHPEEVRAQLDAYGLSELHVEVVSDRHMVMWGVAP
jgi:SAM-dependent methyltransferase